MNRTPLAFDIETVGVEWDSLDEEVQAMVLERARTDEERAEAPERLGLHPGTGRVIAIGMWRPVEGRGGVLVEGEPSVEWEPFPLDGGETDGPEGAAQIFRGGEAELLRQFWRIAGSAGTLISYNGRSFDGPYLMIRSAMLGVAPTRNLVPYRYSFKEHCDLAEVLTFHRSRPMDRFDFWCRQFGIASPKTSLKGSEVAQAYREGRLSEIARYALSDARATAELYQRLQDLIGVFSS